MKEIITLIYIKIQDLIKIVQELRQFEVKALFNYVSKNEQEIFLSDLKSFLEKNRLKFMEEDLLFIVEEFKTQNKIKIVRQEFESYIENELWDKVLD